MPDPSLSYEGWRTCLGPQAKKCASFKREMSGAKKWHQVDDENP